jgi:hypothetical protein
MSFLSSVVNAFSASSSSSSKTDPPPSYADATKNESAATTIADNNTNTSIPIVKSAAPVAKRKVVYTSKQFTLRPLQAPLDEFRVLIVLDASGSMYNIRNDMIGALNTFIVKQKKTMEDEKQATYFTLQQFSSSVKYINFEANLSTINPITESDYVLDGNTALYDGIGNMISHFKDCTNAALVIVTDGEENSSSVFNAAEVKEMIETQKKEKNWEIIYMSQDAAGFKQGTSLGIQGQGTTNIQCHSESFSCSLSNAISDAVTSKKVATKSIGK